MKFPVVQLRVLLVNIILLNPNLLIFGIVINSTELKFLESHSSDSNNNNNNNKNNEFKNSDYMKFPHSSQLSSMATKELEQYFNRRSQQQKSDLISTEFLSNSTQFPLNFASEDQVKSTNSTNATKERGKHRRKKVNNKRNNKKRKNKVNKINLPKDINGIYQADNIRYPSNKSSNDSVNAYEKIKEANEAVKYFMKETIYDISLAIQKLSESAYITLDAFVSDTRYLISIAIENMESAVNLIGIKLNEIDDERIQDLFVKIKRLLEEIENLYKALSDEAEFEFNNVMDYINDTLLDVSYDMEKWSSDIKFKLRSIKNDEFYGAECKQIDNFIADTIEEMYDCCNIAIKPIKSACTHAKTVVGDTTNTIIDFIENVEYCLTERKPFSKMFDCLIILYDRITDLIKSALSLRESLIQSIPTRVIISHYCVSFTTVHVEVRKNEIADIVNHKIADY